jgi:hypothetical protein
MKKFEAETMVLMLCFGLMVNVSAASNFSLGVKNGDWIKYVVEESLSGVNYYQKIEFLKVEETNVTARLTVSGIMEYNQTWTVNLTSQDDFKMELFSFRVYLVSANLTVGDSVYLGKEFGDNTIEGEATRAYAGVDRKVVYSNFSLDETQYAFCWDKATGVLLEGWMLSGNASSSVYKTVFVVETSMWGGGFEWWIFAIAIIAVVCGILTSKFRKKP